MSERVIDRRGRRNWDAETRRAEDQRMGERRRRDRRQAERRDQGVGDDGWQGEDRRHAERRLSNRRLGERRDGTDSAGGTLRGLMGERLGTVYSLVLGIPLIEAARMLSERRIGVAVIVSDDGGLVGVLSERDIVRALAETGEHAASTEIDDYVTRGVWACSPDDLAATAMALMHEHHLRHLPVIEDGHIIGMVSASDLIGAAIGGHTVSSL